MSKMDFYEFSYHCEGNCNYANCYVGLIKNQYIMCSPLFLYAYDLLSLAN